jgi:predicted nuclease of predicted toxin-antitoxin system
MQILADESCARPVIQALRLAGHDVVSIAEVAPGTSDEAVLARAVTEKRILITEDRDFGELIYAQGNPSPGVILIRFQGPSSTAKMAAIVETVAILGTRLLGAFVVVEPGRLRVSTRPAP